MSIKQVEVNVESNPERFQQETVASQARKEAASDGLALKALHELRTVLDAEVAHSFISMLSILQARMLKHLLHL